MVDMDFCKRNAKEKLISPFLIASKAYPIMKLNHRRNIMSIILLVCYVVGTILIFDYYRKNGFDMEDGFIAILGDFISIVLWPIIFIISFMAGIISVTIQCFKDED
jgi:ABC-type amino acid transport system permease subunit